MTNYRFSQTNWKQLVFFSLFPVLMFFVLKEFVAIGWAMLIAILLGVIVQFLFGRYLASVVEFREDHLLLKAGPLREEVIVNYEDIRKASFRRDRILTFYVFTKDKKIKLPPPPRLEKAEELFQWLRTKNTAMLIDFNK